MIEAMSSVYSPPIYQASGIFLVTKEVLQTSDGKREYLLFLKNHPDIEPLCKLYGVESPPAVEKAAVEKHVKKLYTLIHPNNVSPEEREMCRELCQEVESVWRAYNAPKLASDPSLGFFSFSSSLSEQMLREQAAYQAIVNRINKEFTVEFPRIFNGIQQELMLVDPYHMGIAEEICYTVTGALTGCGVGCALGYLGTSLLLSNPVGWMVTITLSLSGMICGAVGLLFSTQYVENNRTERQTIIEEREELVAQMNTLLQIHTEMMEQGLTPMGQFREYLTDSGLLSVLDHNTITFNEARFDQIKDWYPEGVQDQVVDRIRFAIIFGISRFPRHQQPTDGLINELSHMMNHLNNPDLIDAAQVMLGIFYLDKRNTGRASECFERISTQSHFYAMARNAIEAIELVYTGND